MSEIPVVPGEVIGWRAWAVLHGRGYREPRLRSLFHDVVWPTDDWLHATTWEDAGETDNPLIPDPKAMIHGICAARDREHLVGMHRYGSQSHPRYVAGDEDELVAAGEVGLAGVIVPGDRGYRAERARVVSLLLPYIAWDLVDGLARAYRVPVGLANVLTSQGGVVCGHRD